MHAYKEFEIIRVHTDMFVSDFENNILIPLDNATPEVREAIEILNEKMNREKRKKHSLYKRASRELAKGGKNEKW